MTRTIRGSIQELQGGNEQGSVVQARLENVPETIEPELREAGWQREVGSGGAEWWRSVTLDPGDESSPSSEDVAASLHSFMAQFADEIVQL